MRMDNSVSIMNPSLYRQYLNAKIPIISFTSQDSGLWSKLYSGTETWETLGPSRKLFDCPANRRKYEKIKSYCDKHQVSPAALVTAYLACNKVACGPITAAAPWNSWRTPCREPAWNWIQRPWTGWTALSRRFYEIER